jgi:hypothetical protein
MDALTICQQKYDNMQPPEFTISAGDSGTLKGDDIGYWPESLKVKYLIVDTSDETESSWDVEIESAMIGEFDMLEALHDGAKDQMKNDVYVYLVDCLG